MNIFVITAERMYFGQPQLCSIMVGVTESGQMYEFNPNTRNWEYGSH